MIEWIFGLIGVFLAGFVVFAVFVGLVLESRCPRCKKFFARESTRKERWSRWTGSEKTSPETRYYYHCKYCNHEWEEQQERKPG